MTECVFVLVLDNAQRTLGPAYASSLEKRRTSEGLVRMECEFLNVRRLFELEEHAAFFGELLPPDHVYSSESSSLLRTVAHRRHLLLDDMQNTLYGHILATFTRIRKSARFFDTAQRGVFFRSDKNTTLHFTESPRYLANGERREWQYANCCFTSKQERFCAKSESTKVFDNNGTGGLRCPL